MNIVANLQWTRHDDFLTELLKLTEIVDPGGAHDRQGDLSYAKSFID